MTLLLYPSLMESRVHDSFHLQAFMKTLGAELTTVEHGVVEISVPFREDLTQQNGFLHAGVITSIADSACGYAAYSVMPEGRGVLSVEFKINLLAPALGERFVARARVLRSGRTLTVTAADVVAVSGDTEKLIAVMQATMIAV